MKRGMVLAAILGLVLSGAAVASDAADSVTVTGTIVCAKCTLKDEAMKECQNVLQVKKGDEVVNYYLVKNDVAESFGHVCQDSKDATVTGTVAEKDGHVWLTASKMDPVEKS